MSRRVGAAYVCVLVLLLPGLALWAGAVHDAAAAPVQSTSGQSRSAMEAQREALFQRMLDNPADLDAAFAYAAISSKLGDFEGAITALERMLIFAPDLARVQLELGVLYYRLGAYATSRDYFQKAVSGDNVPDEVRASVARYLAEISSNEKRNKFSGSAFAGVKYQTNANAGPASSQININGITFTLNNESLKQGDGNAFFAASLHYDYDLQRQGDLLETDVLFYGAKFLSQGRLDAAVLEVTFGPSFNMQRFNIRNSQLGIYGIGNVVGLDDNLYFGSAGAGMRLVSRPGIGNVVRLKTELRRKWYHNSSARPTADYRDGNEFSGEMSFSTAVGSGVKLHGKARVVREDVRADWYDNWQMGGEAGVGVSIAPLIKDSKLFTSFWLFDVTGGYRHVRYDSPDAAILATEKQRNDEYFIRTSLTVPVGTALAVVPQLEYRRVKSNYDIYAYKNLSATLGLAMRF